MQVNFDLSNTFLRLEEGGYSDDENDGGNWSLGYVGGGALIGSNMGVSAPVLIEWMRGSSVTAQTMRDLPANVQALIARHKYWEPVSGNTLPGGIDLMVFDHGYNRGVGTSLRVLSSVCGNPNWRNGVTALFQAAISKPPYLALLPRLSRDNVRRVQETAGGIGIDGVVGPDTQRAVSRSAPARQIAFLLALYEAQVGDYRQITQSNPKLRRNLNGYLNRANARLDHACRLLQNQKGSSDV